jgi:hypothetical protein
VPEIKEPRVSRILDAWVQSVKGSVKEKIIYSYFI